MGVCVFLSTFVLIPCVLSSALSRLFLEVSTVFDIMRYGSKVPANFKVSLSGVTDLRKDNIYMERCLYRGVKV